MNSSSETTNSGQRANKSGNRLERYVEQALQEKGYTEFPNYKAIAFGNRKAIGGKQYARHLPVGETIYGRARHCDFFIVNKALFPDDLIIECKWQQVSGTVDEKYPFLVFNVTKTGVPTIVLLDGGGYSPAAMKWLKERAHPKAALIGVYNMAEFQTRVNNGLLG